jgi:acyl-coenzyme A thioesterase PaaI-like protein
VSKSKTETAIQDFYEDEVAVCYGCGRNNPQGLHIRTHWDGKEGVCHFKPQPHHTAYPGIVYGGLLANLIDCHSVGTATAASYQAERREPGTEPQIRFVTGTMTVRYLQPTPVEAELVLRARVKEIHEKKVVVTCSLYANGKECAQGEVIVVRAPRDVLT